MRKPQKKRSRLAGGSMLLAVMTGSGTITAAIKSDYDTLVARQQVAAPLPAPVEPEPAAEPEPPGPMPAGPTLPPCPPNAEFVEPPAQSTATVLPGELNLRAAPNGAIMGQVRAGDQLELLEKPFGGWVKVKTRDGRIGFVAQQYVRITAAPRPSVVPAPTKTSFEVLVPCLVLGQCDQPKGDD